MPSRVEIAVLDCSEIKGSLEDVQDTEAFMKFARRLGNALESIGFVYLINHDTEPENVENFYSQAREFFALPDDVKLKYQKEDAVENFHGYTATGEERLAGKFTESFDFSGLTSHDPSAYPSEVPGLKGSVDDFRDSLSDLSKKLCRCFAIYLDLEDKNYLLEQHKAIDDPTVLTHTLIPNNFYFPIETNSSKVGESEESETMRLGEHVDVGTFTFLFQDEVGGLEAKFEDKEWIPIKPIKNSIVLITGLMLEFWSGGRLPATFHRVRAIENCQYSTQRQSCGLFLQPDDTSRCVPLVSQKSGWKPKNPFQDTETVFEYFRNRVRESRGNY